MTIFYSVGDKAIAFGVNWAAIKNPKKEAREAAALGQKQTANYKIRLATKGSIKYGFFDDVAALASSAKKKGNLQSAAVLFATCTDSTANNLYVYKLDDKKAVIIALLAGEPYLDVVVTTSKISERLNNLFDELGGDSFTHYGNYTGQFPDSKELKPEELLTEGDQKAAAMSRFKDLRAARWLVALLVVGIVGMGGVHWWKAEAKRKADEELAKNAIDPAQLYRDALQATLPTLGFEGTTAKATIWATMASREIEVGGWILELARCTRNGRCLEKWNYQSGTNTTFVNANKLGVPRFSADGNSISNAYVVHTVFTPINQNRLPMQDAFWLDFTTMLQKFKSVGMKYTISEAVPFGLPAGVTIANIPVGQKVLTGSYEITGPLGFSEETLTLLPSNVMIDEFSVNPSSDLSSTFFKIKGTYYVKN